MTRRPRVRTEASVLCVDVGNTQVKATLVTGRRARDVAAIPTAFARTRDGLARLRRRMVTVRPDGVGISSVVPDLEARLVPLLEDACGHHPLCVRHDLHLPFAIRVPNPASIGPDRLCAASGALGTRAQTVLVVDVGSAITVDLIDRRRYRGGLILAGPALALAALGRFADRLPSLDWARADRPFASAMGRTEGAMVLGVSVGSVGAIQEAVRYVRRRASGRPTVYLTGGGARRLRARLPAGWRYDPHLVARGICSIWHRNR